MMAPQKHQLRLSLIIFFFILAIHLFFRFYQLGTKSGFGWDQVDNAWSAKNIIIDRKWPLLGFQAKGNSGFYIGPAYYYLISIIYFFTNLDPIASGIFAGLTSIFTFFIFYFLIKKMFSFQVALLAIFIHTFSFHIINANRVQGPVNFISPISLIIFFTLFKIINGELKYLLLLATALGFSFHIHFTCIFFPMIVFLSLPLFPKKRQLLRYSLLSLPLFFIWLIPMILAELGSQRGSTNNMFNYLQTYYHGFHLVRVLQLLPDAFIEFEGILFSGFETFKSIRLIGYFLLPLFCLIYFFSRPSRKRFIFCYLMGLWFFVPWLVFSVYSGEISNYYFYLTRPMIIIILSYLTFNLLKLKNLFVKTSIIVFWLFYSFANTQSFFNLKHRALDDQRIQVKEAIKRGEVIKFQHGVPESYLYYFYTQNPMKNEN